MRIKGLERERQRLKRRYGMRVSGASMKRIQLALMEKLAGAPRTTTSNTPLERAKRKGRR